MRKFYSFFIALLAACGVANAQVTFDFTGETAYELFGLEGFSNNDSNAGDITSNATVSSGDVTITVSPAAEGVKNPNRMWGTIPKGSEVMVGSLRMYSGTLTIQSSGEAITSIKFENGKWGADNTADCGTLETGKWTGSSQKVVITIAANTQIKTITVSFGDNPDPDPNPTEIDWTSSATAPLTVPQAIERAAQLQEGESSSSNKVYVKGKISQIKYTFSADYGTAQFHISEDGEKANEFLCYGSYYLGNRSWVDGDKQIAVGDEVIMCGTITNYQGTTEFANKQNYIYSLNGEVGEEIPVPEYTKISELKEIATAAHAQVIYKASDVLVTFVSGSSVYVTDGTDGMLLYGKNSGIKAGDKASFSAKGELYLYNGLTEISVSEYADLTVASSDNEVTAQKATIADVTNNYSSYENELVTIEGLTPAAAAWDDQRCVPFTDDSDNTIVVRDNFTVAASLTFDATTTYTITGFMAVRATEEGTEYRIYPRAISDIDNGVIPDPFKAEGEGTLEKPYTINDVKGLLGNNLAPTEAVWVHGYIVACANGSLDKLVFDGTSEDAIASNLMMASAAGETEKNNMIPVALPTGPVRVALNVKDNPANIGKEVWVLGVIQKYFSVAGVKNTSDYSFDGKSTGVADLISSKSNQPVYNLAGQRLQTITRSGLYIVGGKKVVVK